MANIIEATTRNSNLQNQLKNDKNTKINGVKNYSQNKSSSSNGTRVSEKRERQEDMSSDLNNSQKIATPSGTVSIEQLKELMKNPQIASFLKHQLEL